LLEHYSKKVYAQLTEYTSAYLATLKDDAGNKKNDLTV